MQAKDRKSQKGSEVGSTGMHVIVVQAFERPAMATVHVLSALPAGDYVLTNVFIKVLMLMRGKKRKFSRATTQTGILHSLTSLGISDSKTFILPLQKSYRLCMQEGSNVGGRVVN